MGSGAKTPVWLDCDTGHDDAFAILLSAHHPSSTLLGVSTVHGNAPLEHTTSNTLAVLEALGCASVPVVKGAPGPLQREASFAPDIHGASGLDGVTLLCEPRTTCSRQSISDVPAVILAQPSGTVHIVATGPLTNIALMLSAAPQLAEHIAGLSIMGGAVGGGFTDAPMGLVKGQGERFGNWSPWAEFNIYADPEAARAVFSNELLARKTTLIPLDLTHQVRGTKAVQAQLFGAAKQKPTLPPLRELYREILTFFSETYASHFNITDGPPLHDPLAVWAALRPDSFGDVPKERWAVDIDTQAGGYHAAQDPQNHRGQTVLRATTGPSGVRVPRTLDMQAFWDDIDDALTAATNANGRLKT